MRRLFGSAELAPGGSLRFPIAGREPGHAGLGFGAREGFAVRAPSGALRAYLNACPHRGQPVDLGDGKLFARDGTLECQAHGAYFDPATGACVRGPCTGDKLTPLGVEEHEGAVWLLEGDLAPVPLDPLEEPFADLPRALDAAADLLDDGV